jgi:ComF family protein
MFSRIKLFLTNVFLLPEIPPDFSPLFIDKNEHYRETVHNWSLDATYVALLYTDELKKELEPYKYFSRKEKADLFIPHLFECFSVFCLEKIDKTAIITSVPIFFFSYLKRGYNHSEVLARTIAKQSGNQYISVLRKTKWTRHQAKLNKHERIKNVRDTFSFRKKYKKIIQGKDIILIDDIISTGSTTNECAKVLKLSGAKHVYGLFLATGD